MKIPLFPLNTVLYPEGPLPLRIFEPRYLDMISSCLKDDLPFGVVQIRRGSETGASESSSVGTLARISDWYQGSDGILGVTAVGGERFRVLSKDREADGLLTGDVELLPADEQVALPSDFQSLVPILDSVLDDLGRLYEDLPRRHDDAAWVGFRFAEILPIDPKRKQAALELTDPIRRLQLISEVLDDVRGVDT